MFLRNGFAAIWPWSTHAICGNIDSVARPISSSWSHLRCLHLMMTIRGERRQVLRSLCEVRRRSRLIDGGWWRRFHWRLWTSLLVHIRWRREYGLWTLLQLCKLVVLRGRACLGRSLRRMRVSVLLRGRRGRRFRRSLDRGLKAIHQTLPVLRLLLLLLMRGLLSVRRLLSIVLLKWRLRLVEALLGRHSWI